MHFKNVVILEFSQVDFIDDLKLNSLIKMARKLKVLSIASCDRITRIPDFFGCPYLERLTFEHCSKLRKIDSSIGKLKYLIYLSIYVCFGLEDLPEEIGNLLNLQHFSIQHCKVKKLPYSIWKLKSLRELHFVNSYDGLDSTNSWELPSAIRMLHNLEKLHVCSHSLKGQIPHEIGSLPLLRILNLSRTQLSEVPKSISILTCLKGLELMGCDKFQELPMLPASLTYLYVRSTSLRVVPDLSNLTNLVELDLISWGGGDKPCIGELRWIGRLSKLTTLRLGLHNVHVPTELASLPLLNQLDLFGLDLQTFPQLPSSLQELRVDNFNFIVSLSQNLINLSCLGLYRSPMQEFELNGHQLPNIRDLSIVKCESLKRFRLSSMRKLVSINVLICPKLVELRFSRLESLDTLYIQYCESFGRLVDVGEAGHDNNESANKLISGEGTLILPLRALNKLRRFVLRGCPHILEMQIVGTSESWEYFGLYKCPYVQNLDGLSNLKNLKRLYIHDNEQLQVIKGLDELEFLEELRIQRCGYLESLIDLSNTKLPHIYLRMQEKL
ncbi:protein SUPPRESSOR OF npr1-1, CONSTITUTIVE 1-like [Eucalyptus grandis]|uniref:protein SUPPRESSOR OF npr1-1, CONSTITUTIVE 1-like n=1 Tax=Eucalyptus grandis TaxID=71139 RepID=UPI00192EC278|nr:protein SUPPRESSOR OF npr1-1, CONSTITUTIVE 1-like [Eucalyptus grandis]